MQSLAGVRFAFDLSRYVQTEAAVYRQRGETTDSDGRLALIM
jgi:hypothetical protein